MSKEKVRKGKNISPKEIFILTENIFDSLFPALSLTFEFKSLLLTKVLELVSTFFLGFEVLGERGVDRFGFIPYFSRVIFFNK